MQQTCIYLTRTCPYSCDYCRLRNQKLSKPELTAEKWVGVMGLLSDLKMDFNLFLGNETWLYGKYLPIIVNTGDNMPYAVYTSCQPNLFKQECKTMFEGEKSIDNLSCGCDFPMSMSFKQENHKVTEILKAYNAYRAFITTRTLYPNVDCQGTITISKRNIHVVFRTINDLQNLGVNVGLNFIHTDHDDGFDFFPKPNEMRKHLLDILSPDEQNSYIHLYDYLKELKRTGKHLIQNLDDTLELMDIDWNDENGGLGIVNTCWHCKGDPYGGPTIDADGSLRCCGYRKGTETPKLSIYDLDNDVGYGRWKEAVFTDANKCPGCVWSYPRLYAHYKNKPEQARKVFVNHAQLDNEGNVVTKNERIIQ